MNIYTLRFAVKLILFASVLAVSCSPVPEADFYEVGGAVSINARSLSEQNNWKLKPTSTSMSMVSQADTASARGALTFPFYVRNPGEYTVYLLANLTDKAQEEKTLPVQIMDEDQFLIQSSRLRVDQSPVLKWHTYDADSEVPVTVHFEAPGHYVLRLESAGRDGFVVDKLHLTFNNEHQPYGFALPETSNPGQDPFLIKRDERIVIPPAWAFGVLFGGIDGLQQSRELAEYLVQENIPADGIWIKTGNASENVLNLNDLNDTRDFLHENRIMTGIEWDDELMEHSLPADARFDFLKLSKPSGIDVIESAFETTMLRGHVPESRGFLLSQPNIAYHSEFKKFPTLHSGFSNGENLTFDGLREQIDMSANLRLSTYEIPYLAHRVPFYSQNGETIISEELFIRWIQFAAFNTIMLVEDEPKNEILSDVSGISGQAEQQFRELTELRNRLFPYLYSLAHLVRATREKPVRGDGSNTTQFQLGDAMLVAPMYEEGEEERLVYFPPGLWYDYWNGTEYDGGSSWIVEAPLDKIPVFVRAGSIIPYRDYSRSILAGTNDKLIIEIYGGGASSFRLYEDDGVTTRYQLGEFTTTAFRYFEHPDYSTFTIGRMVRSYQGQSPEKKLELRFKYVDEPVGITANEEVLERGEGENQWRYNHGLQTLIINWKQPNYQKTDFRIDF